MASDLTKQTMYEAVKQLVDCSSNHIHLPQQKLFTLFSIGFQYLLYKSTKEPGYYIIRIQDSRLCDRLAKRAKDLSTRRFLQKMLLSRKFKYNQSIFLLDFFHVGSWALTNEAPKDKIKGALVVKNTVSNPMTEIPEEDLEEGLNPIINSLPENYYLESLKNVAQTIIAVAFDENYDGLERVNFSFIKEDEPKAIKGVKIADHVTLDD